MEIDRDTLFKMHVIDGIKIDDIAKYYNVKRSTISRLFKIHSIPSKHSVGDDYEKAIGAYNPDLDDYNIMYRLYVLEEKSTQEIADLYNKKISYVNKKLRKLGIELRHSHENNIIRNKEKSKHYSEETLNYKKMYELYIIEEKSLDEISNLYDTPKKELVRRFRKLNLKKYLRKKERFLRSICDELKNKDVLYNLYINEQQSISQIAKLYNESTDRIKRLLIEYGIPLRTQKEAAKLLCGEKSPHWKGVSYSLYEKIRAYSRDNLHKKVKERDNYECQICGSKENLQVHHKTPLWKIYEEILSEHPEYNHFEDIEELREIIVKDPRINDFDNLITCCEECHLFKLHKYTHREVEALKKRTRIKNYK